MTPLAASVVAETEPPDWLPVRLPLKAPLNSLPVTEPYWSMEAGRKVWQNLAEAAVATRFDQVKGVSDADRELAFANITAAAKHYGVRMGEQSWKELMHEPRP